VGTFRVLFIGDLVGAPGLQAVKKHLPGLVARTRADLVVANGENVAGGFGITAETARAIHAAGVSVITTGNHVWDRREILDGIRNLPRLLRPANYPPTAPGRGWCVVAVDGVNVGVLNLSGRVFMDALDCPFQTADRVLQEMPADTRVVLVDFHAEATSEKRAFGWYLDGRVSAVVGTHTHVPTADAQVLPQGTGYITDVGMTGVAESVIGVPKDRAIKRFLSQVRSTLGVAKGEGMLCGVVIEIDSVTGHCLGLERVEVGGPAARRGPAEAGDVPANPHTPASE
jgi:metallophosphoesterase (TIGR00282 family)